MTENKDWSIEIENHINKTKKAYFALITYLIGNSSLEEQKYVCIRR